MDEEEKTNMIFTRPEEDSFENFKEWFEDLCNMIGAKGEISDRELRSLWKEFQKARKAKKTLTEKMKRECC